MAAMLTYLSIWLDQLGTLRAFLLLARSNQFAGRIFFVPEEKGDNNSKWSQYESNEEAYRTAAALHAGNS